VTRGVERSRPIGSLLASAVTQLRNTSWLIPNSPAISGTLRRLSSTSCGPLREFFGVLAPSAHPGPPSLAGAKSGGVHPTVGHFSGFQPRVRQQGSMCCVPPATSPTTTPPKLTGRMAPRWSTPALRSPGCGPTPPDHPTGSPTDDRTRSASSTRQHLCGQRWLQFWLQLRWIRGCSPPSAAVSKSVEPAGQRVVMDAGGRPRTRS
jgi:hypothetical protein